MMKTGATPNVMTSHKTVQFLAELAGLLRHPGDVAVQHVEDHAQEDQHGGVEGQIDLRVVGNVAGDDGDGGQATHAVGEREGGGEGGKCDVANSSSPASSRVAYVCLKRFRHRRRQRTRRSSAVAGRNVNSIRLRRRRV